MGAGPAGLTAAYLLGKEGARVTVLEADPNYVGGISKTVNYKGFHFDIGGHRFFSKSRAVEDLWTELLPNDMLVRPRSSRIFYNGKFFSYPLKAGEALIRLGPIEALRCVLSYLKARLFPFSNPRNFEEWVSNKFGARLFDIFFKTYTEKVWGMPCREISADWAAQRIKGLSLTSAVMAAILPKRKTRDGKVIKTLIDSFRYPRRGPGMMWEACAEKVRALGGEIAMGRQVRECRWNAERREWTVDSVDLSGDVRTDFATHLVSSAPVRQLVEMLRPAVTPPVAQAGASLRYRDFLTVVVIARERHLFSDNWIYIHDPSVKVGRVQNFKSWSPEMVPDQALACYGLEYFCFEGDGLWTMSDAQLGALACKELIQLGLVNSADISDTAVVRQKKAYPVYDDDYALHLEAIRAELEENFPTLHLIGRNGMHKYNNQDHSMMTAMLCVKNIFAGKKIYDLWRVNEDAEYHESGEAGTSAASGLRMTPRSVPANT
jgi:protoporphyrinogen oxidase